MSTFAFLNDYTVTVNINVACRWWRRKWGRFTRPRRLDRVFVTSAALALAQFAAAVHRPHDDEV